MPAFRPKDLRDTYASQLLTAGAQLEYVSGLHHPHVSHTRVWTRTVPSLVFLMTPLNIRLGYWLANPRFVRESSGVRRLLLRRGAVPLQILREAISGLHNRGSHVNVSDGGHLENLAVYELLRRRCQFIVSVDAEADPNHRFGALVRPIRFAKIDMGIKIEIDLSDLEKDERGLCRKHSAVGTIRYGEGQIGRVPPRLHSLLVAHFGPGK